MHRHPKAFSLALALACSLGGVSAGPAGAFVIERYPDRSNGKWYPIRWTSRTQPVRFVLNDQTHAMLPDFLSDSAPSAAVEAAMRTWAFAPVGMHLEGLTSTRISAGRDNFNLITLANTAANRDIVSDNIAVTLIWSTSRGSLSYWPLAETDVVFNPKAPIATDGRSTAFDLQAVLTHELGHALGLGHSSIPAATMWPYGDQGETRDRTPDADDVASVHAAYGELSDGSHGTISGRVLAPGDVPVFGATVIATDPQGIARSAAFTERDGSYAVSWLPPGIYSVHAEPMNAELTTDMFSSNYYQTAWRDFPTAFLGGNNQPILVPVTAGADVAVNPIRITSQRPRLSVQALGSAPSGQHFAQFGLQALTLKPGSSTCLLIAAEGLTANTQILASGIDIGFDQGSEWIDTLSDGTPYVFLPMSVRPGAAPGARNLYLTSPAEASAFSGAIKVIAP